MKNIELKFINYLANLWLGSFSHSFKITKHLSWNEWKSNSKYKNNNCWQCNNLKEAFENYSWTVSEKELGFEELSNELKKSLADNDNDRTGLLCKQIFKWGGVSRNLNKDSSQIWINKNVINNTLVNKILDATFLLHPKCQESLSRFNKYDLLMNSSTTKVFAAASIEKNIIIYDGRVGAALGLIVRSFLAAEGINEIPKELAFLWGPPSSPGAAKLKTRDPSKDQYIFKMIPNNSSKPTAHEIRAELTRRSSLYILEAINRIKSQEEQVAIQDFERALFMLGYDVRN